MDASILNDSESIEIGKYLQSLAKSYTCQE